MEVVSRVIIALHYGNDTQAVQAIVQDLVALIVLEGIQEVLPMPTSIGGVAGHLDVKENGLQAHEGNCKSEGAKRNEEVEELGTEVYVGNGNEADEDARRKVGPRRGKVAEGTRVVGIAVKAVGIPQEGQAILMGTERRLVDIRSRHVLAQGTQRAVVTRS